MSASLAFISSCKHELDYPDGNGNPIDTTTTPIDTSGNDTTIIPPPPPVDTMICFESQILPLFISNCAMPDCHDAITHEEGLRLYDYSHIISHISAFNPTSGSVMHSIMNGSMPPNPYNNLSNDQIALIQQWINQGALNTTNCASTCDTTAFTYSADIAPMMGTYCNGCHSGSFPSGGINTSTHAGLQTSVNNGSLLGSVQHASGFSAMPKSAAKMDDCNITKIRKWIQAGALNN